MPTTNRIKQLVFTPSMFPTLRYLLDLKQYTLVDADDNLRTCFPVWGVSIRIFPDPEHRISTVYLASFRSNFRNQRNGDNALNFMVKLADKHAVNILLSPRPEDKQTKQPQLINWFTKYGFAPTSTGLMLRTAQ